MRSVLILISFAVLTAGCARQIDGCSGWARIELNRETPPWLAENDPGMLRATLGHNEFGEAQGCW
jgi:hypothetical protein